MRGDCEGNLYISHSPYERGENFEQYLQQYHHGTMILNVKSERIELTILPMQGMPAYDDKKLNRDCPVREGGANPEKEDRVMLRRRRISRIFYNKCFSGRCTRYGILRYVKLAAELIHDTN